ncbi:MAG: hypothetical protein IJX76_07550 [Clostridia bacterium]|nr:hypothetical protein [Clostridia bacterium]
MKKFAFILLLIVLCASMSVLAVSADAVMGTWTKVSDTEYSVQDHQNGNDYFDYYELGKSEEVTLSADIVATTGDPQRGFLLGVVDLNEDGKITENGDQYYLVCFQNSRISIERNDQRWGDWAQTNIDTGVAAGETCTLKVIYKKGTLQVYANDKLLTVYSDTKPWKNGTGFGLAYKFGDKATFANVSVDTETAVNIPLGVGGVDVSKAEDNVNWTVEDNKYTLNITENGYGNARFASYALGNSDKKVTITGKFTFGEQIKWGVDNGGDNGFLFAIADMNNDGKITEGGDYYYLVDVKADAGNIGIEKNPGRWGDWIAESPALGLEVGKEYEVSASYDPATGTIVVTVDGTEVLNWTDPNPLSGTGYAIASKTYGFVMSDVAVVDEAVPPVETEDDPAKTEDQTPDQTEDKPAETGDMTTLAASVAVLALIGTGVIVSKKRRFN